MVERTVTSFRVQQRAKVQREARKRRAKQLTLVAERRVRKKLRRAGFRPTSAQVSTQAGKFEVIGGQIKLLKVEAPTLFDISGKRAKPKEELVAGKKVFVTRGFSKADIAKGRAQEATTTREAKRVEQRAKDRGIVTGTPSASVLLTQLEQTLPKREARKQKVLKLPVSQVFEAKLTGQKTFQLRSGKKVKVPGIVSREDVKKAERTATGRVAAKGQEAQVARVAERIAVQRLKTEAKEVLAVEKAEIRIKALNRFNKAVSGAVDKTFNVFAGKRIEGDFKTGFKTVKGTPRFEEDAAKQAVKVIAAFSPPSVVANLIGSGLVVADLGEAGIIKKVGVKAAQATFGSLTPTGVRKAVKGLKNLDEQDFVRVKDKTVRLVSRLGKNIDPTTSTGLGNLIGLAAIFRADKAASAGTKRLLASVKRAPGVKNLRLEVDRTVKALLRSKKAQARLTPGAKKSARIIRKSKRAPGKAEIRKRVQAFKVDKLTPQQKKFDVISPLAKAKKAREKEVARLVAKVKPGRTPTEGQIIKGKFVKATPKEKRVVKVIARLEQKGISFARLPQARLSKSLARSSKEQIRKVGRAVDKEVRVGKSFLLTKQKVNLARTAPKKSQKSLKVKVKREALKRREERFVKTSDVVNKDLRPENLYSDLIIPETIVNTKGWRPGTKSKVLAQVKKQQDVLKKVRLDEFKDFRNRLDSVLKSEYSNIAKRNEIEGKLLEKFLSPRFSRKDILSVVKDKRIASKFDKSLKALSSINFKIDFTDKIKFNVASIPIAKKKVDIRLDVREKVISEIKPITRVPKKPIKKVVKLRKLIIKPKLLVKPKLAVIPFKPLKLKILRRPGKLIKRPVLPKIPVKFKKPKVKFVKKKLVSKGFTEFTTTVVKPKLSKEEKRTRGILLGGVELFTGAELRGKK